MNIDNEAIWRALSDPTRRRLLDLLRDGPRTTGDLAKLFPGLSRYAVMKHLGVLEEAALLVVERQGRQRWNYLNPVPIRQIYERWITRFMDSPARLAISLKRHIDTKNQKDQEDE